MGGIFDLAAGASQDLVLSRPGTLSSTTLARLARLARWQAAPAGRPEGTTGKQLSHKQRPYRVTAALPPTWPTCLCGGAEPPTIGHADVSELSQHMLIPKPA